MGKDKKLENKIKAMYVDAVEQQDEFEFNEVMRISESLQEIFDKSDRAHFMDGLAWVLAEANYTRDGLKCLVNEALNRQKYNDNL